MKNKIECLITSILIVLITTKDGTELIAVPCAEIDAPCNGCFFYKNGECTGWSASCWSEIDGELIFITKKK